MKWYISSATPHNVSLQPRDSEYATNKYSVSTQRIIVLEGGKTEGDWDDFDFTLKALPIRRRIDPGPMAYVPTKQKDEGRPGMARLAGVTPGDELVGLWTQPGVRVEAGRMGRAWIAEELRRMGQWTRHRGRGIPSRDRFLGHEHTESKFPWKLEFRKKGFGGVTMGKKRQYRLPPLDAFLKFRVFREVRRQRDGGCMFTVRVVEDTESNKTLGDPHAAKEPLSKKTTKGQGRVTQGQGPFCDDRNFSDSLRLLGLPREATSMVLRRSSDDRVLAGRPWGSAGQLSSSTSKGRNDPNRSPNGINGGVGGTTIVPLDGEERVVLSLKLDYDKGGCGITNVRHHASHLLAGLVPDAARMVKERVYAEARVQYARLYGLRPSVAVAPSTLPEREAPRATLVPTVPPVAPASATEPVPTVRAAPSILVDLGTASWESTECNDNDAAKDSIDRNKSKGKLVAGVKAEPTVSIFWEREDGEKEEKEKGPLSVAVEAHEGIKSTGNDSEVLRGMEQSAAMPLECGASCGDVRKPKGATALDGSKGAASTGSCGPGSGALTVLLRNMIHSDAFLTWVEELRRRSSCWRDVEAPRIVTEKATPEATTTRRKPLRFAIGMVPILRSAAVDPYASNGIESEWAGKMEEMGRYNINRGVVFSSKDEAIARNASSVQQVNLAVFSAEAEGKVASDDQDRHKVMRLAAVDAAARLFPAYVRARTKSNSATARARRVASASTAAAAVDGLTTPESKSANTGPTGSASSAANVNTITTRASASITSPSNERKSSAITKTSRRTTTTEGFSAAVDRLLRAIPAPSPAASSTSIASATLTAPTAVSLRTAGALPPMFGMVRSRAFHAGPWSNRLSSLDFEMHEEEVRQKCGGSRGKGIKSEGRVKYESGDGVERSTRISAVEKTKKSAACCDICDLPLTSMCECSLRSLTLRRKCWTQQLASFWRHNITSIGVEIPRYKTPEENFFTPLREDVASHRRRRTRHKLRYDQSVSLQHRGLLRFPVTSNVSSIKFAQSSTGTSCTGSKSTTPKLTGPSSTAETPLPRLEEWPCFPSPATAFAPAAPVESPKGLMPPSPRLLRYIHQMASTKVHGMPEQLYGSLDETALLAVGVLVEEMMEELIAPLVDGRTKGYKHLTPASLARELAFSSRNKRQDKINQPPTMTPPQRSCWSASAQHAKPCEEPLHKRRKHTATPATSKEGVTVANDMGACDMSELCRVFGERVPDVVRAWRKIETLRSSTEEVQAEREDGEGKERAVTKSANHESDINIRPSNSDELMDGTECDDLHQGDTSFRASGAKS